MVGIDDIVAALIMSLAMLRRLGVVSTLHEHNPGVPEADFRAWKRRALFAYNLTAGSCFLKVVLSAGWFWLMKGRDGLRVGGLVLFIAWVIALVAAWYLAGEARAVKNQLGIDPRPN